MTVTSILLAVGGLLAVVIYWEWRTARGLGQDGRQLRRRRRELIMIAHEWSYPRYLAHVVGQWFGRLIKRSHA